MTMFAQEPQKALKKRHVIFASKNMLLNCTIEDKVALCSDETYKTLFEGCVLLLRGMVDKQIRFHPTSTTLTSNYDTSIYF